MVGTIEDITDRKELEEELSRISAFEQQRIGQELHDGVGSELVGLALMAKGLQKSLEDKGLLDADAARELVESMQSTQRSVRGLIRGVRPVEVDAGGLMVALDELAEGTQALTNIPCEFTSGHAVSMGDDHVAAQLFHIAQEAVRNAVKHAGATRIAIGLDSADGRVTMWVRDDGKGIGGERREMSGMGLRIMRYRAGIIGAALDIRPAEDGGTLVACTVHQEQWHERQQ
jgi:signal transduction histidine kinase